MKQRQEKKAYSEPKMAHVKALPPRVSTAYNLGLSRIKGRLLGTHQHSGVQWMLAKELLDTNCPGGLLADDCGCGKTYTTICAMKGNPQPATLIVTVVSTVHQWRDILTSFGCTTPFVVSGDCTLRTVPSGTEVVLTTYSVFAPKKRGRPVPAILRNTRWSRIILDEGHYIKNQNGATFSNIDTLFSSIRWVLTATPVQNSMKDIMTLARWVGWTGNIEDFMAIKMLRRTLATEGDKNPRFKLPKLESEVIRLRFTFPHEQDVYDCVKNEFKTRIEHTTDGCKLYTEALQGILRCRQACCHYKLIEDLPGKSRKRGRGCSTDANVICNLDSTKFAYICNDIRSHLSEKSIIFCMWTKEIEYMLKALDYHNVSALKFDGSMTKERREETLYNFKNTGINALVIQIQAGGVGLNLQCATRVYITSPTWNPTHEIQAICRSHRLGQEQIVKCFRLIVEDTIEERMIEIQNKKMAIISDALDDHDLLHKLCDADAMDTSDIRNLFM